MRDNNITAIFVDTFRLKKGKEILKEKILEKNKLTFYYCYTKK